MSPVWEFASLRVPNRVPGGKSKNQEPIWKSGTQEPDRTLSSLRVCEFVSLRVVTGQRSRWQVVSVASCDF